MENSVYSKSATRRRSEPDIDENENDITGQHGNLSQSHSNGSAKLISSVYLIVLTMLGLLLPLQDSVAYSWLGTVPYIVFLMYLSIVSILFLLFVQFYLLRSEAPRCAVSWCNRCPSSTATGRGHNRGRRATAISTITIETNGEPSNPAVLPVYIRNFNKSFSPPQQEDERATNSLSILACRSRAGSLVITDQQPGPLISLTRESRGVAWTSPLDGDAASTLPAQCDDEYNNDVISNEDEKSVFWMDLDKLGNLFSHQGSSLYLRIGALVFGIGNVIYLALEIEHWLSPTEGCQSSQFFGWSFIFRLIFIIVQTCIIFKNTKVQIVRFQELAHFGCKHVIATNLCLWLHTLIHEVVEEFKHKKKSTYYSQNDTTTASTLLSSSTSKQQTVDNAMCSWDPQLLTVSRYLFPFVLEYSLIAIGAMTCIIYTGIESARESHGHLQIARGIKNFIKVFGYQNKLRKQSIDSNIGFENVQSSGHADNHAIFSKSHTGLFIGLLLLAGVITSIVLFYFANGDNDYEKSTLIYWITDVILQGSLLFGCCLALVLTRNMAFVDRPLSPDDFLLFLSMIGSIMFEMSIFIVYINSDSPNAFRALGLTSSSLGVCQTILQTCVIMHAMRRYPITANDVIRMPGRGTFTFLIIGNLAAWIQRTMQIKELGHEEWESSVVWVLIVNISLPLLLFYRFHASVCFADIWHVAYTPLQHDVTAATSNDISPGTRTRRVLPLVSSPTFQQQPSPGSVNGDQSETSLELPRITVTEPDTTEQCDDVMSVELESSSSSA